MEYLRERMRWFSRLIISDMPEEREIEKQLRAAAQQRREDAGGKFELHSASRRLLQGEVVRVRGQKSTPPRRVFWPRFAWGTAMLAVLAVGVWVLVSSQKKSENMSYAFGKRGGFQDAFAAKDDQRSLTETRADSRPIQAEGASKPKEMTIVNSSTMKEERPTAVATLDRANSGVITTEAEGVAAPASGSKSVATIILPARETSRTTAVAAFDMTESKAKIRQEEAAAPPAPKTFTSTIPPEVKVDRPAAETALVMAGSKGKTIAEPSEHYNFSNAITVSRGNANRFGIAGIANTSSLSKRAISSAGDTNMLKSFQIELAGNQIRIRDQDGSIYEGTLLADTREAGVMADSQSMNAMQESRSKSLGISAQESYSIADGYNRRSQQSFRFIASGTNFSLGQRVTIKAEFSADANAANKSTFKEHYFPEPPLKTNVQNNARLSNGRIVGRAITADGQVIEMNASQL